VGSRPATGSLSWGLADLVNKLHNTTSPLTGGFTNRPLGAALQGKNQGEPNRSKLPKMADFDRFPSRKVG
jgi:hypothetical protein